MKRVKKCNEDVWLLFLTVCCFLLFYWQMEGRIQLEKERSLLLQQQQQLSSIENFANDHPVFLAEKARLDERQQQIETFLPKEKKLGDFLQQVQIVADDSKVQLKKWSPIEEQRTDRLHAWPVEMELEGDYFSLRTFFWQLQQLPRFVQIKQMEITVTKNTLHCTLTVFVYSKV